MCVQNEKFFFNCIISIKYSLWVNLFLYYEKKVDRANNTTNNNKMNNHLSPHIIEHKKKTTTFDNVNQDPGLRQAQKCGRVKPFNVIPTLTLNFFKILLPLMQN